MVEARTIASRTRLLVLAALLALAVSAPAAGAAGFGIVGFDGETLDAGGAAYSQAGGHPFVATTTIQLNRGKDSEGETVPAESVRRLNVELPPGYAGNPQATPTRCTEAELTGGPTISLGTCPISSQVGVAEMEVPEGFFEVTTVPVYNMVPAADEPAQLGIRYLTTDIHIATGVRSEGDYGITATLEDVSNAIPLLGTTLKLWGVPADPAHDAERGICLVTPEPGDECPTDAPPRAFWTLPTACPPAGSGLEERMQAESWLGSRDAAAFLTHQPPAAPAPGPPQGPGGCERVPFEPTFRARPTATAADSPTGLQVDMTIPQQGLTSATGTASSALRDATVTLPAGMAVNPSLAAGLAACSPEQIGLRAGGFPEPRPIRFSAAPARCPNASKLGTVEIQTPLLEDPMQGAVYLAQQGSNPFGSLLAIYLVAEGHGVVVKLPGRVATDPSTGQVTVSFEDNPQLPFERLHLELFSGQRASLTTPERCGSYRVSARLVPWSGGAPVEASNEVTLGEGPGGSPCPGGGFDPKLAAGTRNPVAGRFSPFLLDLSRSDGSPRLGSFSATLPKGLLARLAGVPYCPEAALAAVPGGAGTAAAQLASPSCPAPSQVGTVIVGAGSGSPLFVDTGRAYLAGPYKGAPLSLAVVTPALAGPFDLGNVVDRVALRLDPETAIVTADTDPLPTILQGIPLDLREVRVDLGRDEFTLNPTSCDPMRVSSTVTSATGAVAYPAARFQVSGCERLRFAPRLSLRLRGAARRGAFPKLTAQVRARNGEAGIGRVSVALPHAEFLAQEHIGTVCTRVQFAADRCPAASIYGFAEARTPLLAAPLKGPVYLRSNGSERKLPDLVVALSGQFEVDLVGFIDSVHGGLRTRFEEIPDAPVSSFTLRMKGGAKSLLVNSTNICQGRPRATVKMTGQNGKLHDTRPPLRRSCRRTVHR